MSWAFSNSRKPKAITRANVLRCDTTVTSCPESECSEGLFPSCPDDAPSPKYHRQSCVKSLKASHGTSSFDSNQVQTAFLTLRSQSNLIRRSDSYRGAEVLGAYVPQCWYGSSSSESRHRHKNVGNLPSRRVYSTMRPACFIHASHMFSKWIVRRIPAP